MNPVAITATRINPDFSFP